MAAARSAVVIGAGVGGLAVAGALARTGWRVTLLERAERLRAEPVALLLWPAGLRALQALGVGHGLDAVTTPVPDQGVRRPDGQWLVPPASARSSSRHAAGRTVPRPRESRESRESPQGSEPALHPRLVHAEDLHDALVAGLGDQVGIHPGVTVRRMAVADPASTDRPAVTDGRATWTADLVVAADGVDSVLRPRVTRRSGVVSAGATAWRALIPWHRAPQLPEELAAGGHTHGGDYQFSFAPLGHLGGGQRGATGGSSRGGCYWRATVVGAPRPEPAEAQLNLLRRWFAGWHQPIEELLAATEPQHLVQRELRVVRPAPDRYAVPVGSGALVLIGDAGHAMPEHLGQGACLALEDAATLVAMVGEAEPGPPLQAAVDSYQADRRPRLAEVLRRSSRLGATGPFARRAPVLARRRDKAATAATAWQPPAAG